MINLMNLNREEDRPATLAFLEDSFTSFLNDIPTFQEVLETVDAFSKVMLRGRVVDQIGSPVAGALVEMWHPVTWGFNGLEYGPSFAPVDPDEQCWACCITDENGEYFFRTEIRTNQPGLPSSSIDLKVTDENAAVVLTKIYFNENVYDPADPYLMDMEIEDRSQLMGIVKGGVCEYDIML